MDNVKRIIASTLIKLLRPLMRVLLKNNIPYGTFADIAKWVYVDVASEDFGVPGRKQTISRISTITGLSRKEVKKMKEIEAPYDLGAAERYNRAARVISGWIKDPRFLDGGGKPARLPFEGDAKSFSVLVRAYSGDVPPRAILDEMLRAGVVEMNDRQVRLLNRGYIVKKGEVEKFGIMGRDVSELISTIHHNIASAPEDAFFQRKVSYDNIPVEVYPEVRSRISDMAAEFVESMDRVISQYDRDMNPSVQGTGRKKLGLGVFYFEE
ncbi:hypothetical protein MNBD_NITROSPIRAE03-819 [hydrothermal vent metagenome]|uniref:Uncharacterized protein n=1 Tax=hydrothermal vent metagenome TaxID=652676 RepID=A0A3B1DS15_9ZZZZ